jgi:hypothetical protein
MTRAAIAMAALLVAGQAIAQDITLDGVARSVSLVSAIERSTMWARKQPRGKAGTGAPS